MTRSTPSPLGILVVSALAGLAVVLIGGAVVSLAGLHDQGSVWDAERAEQAKNPAIIAISEPDMQPAGTDVADWDEGDSHFRARFGANGEVSLSDPHEPTPVQLRQSAPVVPCSTLHLDTYQTHDFQYDDKSYRVLLTSNGNAAICLQDG